MANNLPQFSQEDLDELIEGRSTGQFFIATDRVQAILTKYNISRRQISEKAGIHSSTISRALSKYAVHPNTAEYLIVALWDTLGENAKRELLHNSGPLFQPAPSKTRHSSNRYGQLNFNQLVDVPPEPTGVLWTHDRKVFEISKPYSTSDIEVTTEKVTQQLFAGIKRKSQQATEVSFRLSNSEGWKGLVEAISRFNAGCSVDIQDIPENLGILYDSMLEIASFIEQNERIEKEGHDLIEPLPADVNRAVVDLVRNGAPWLRLFPTIRNLDDQAGAFLTRPALVDPARQLLLSAKSSGLIPQQDSSRLLALATAVPIGDLQGKKASTRVVSSTKNLVLAAASVLSGFFMGAVASDYATKSTIVQRIGRVLADTEDAATQLVSDLPADLRVAFRSLVQEAKGPTLNNGPGGANDSLDLDLGGQ